MNPADLQPRLFDPIDYDDGEFDPEDGDQGPPPWVRQIPRIQTVIPREEYL